MGPSLLQSWSTVFETILLGSFLFIIWSGLCWADAHLVNLQLPVLRYEAWRGRIWRSKTKSNGHPFGVMNSGFAVLESTFGWSGFGGLLTSCQDALHSFYDVFGLLDRCLSAAIYLYLH